MSHYPNAVRFLLTITLLVICLTAGSVSGGPSLGPTKNAIVIRVGVTEYQNIEATYDKYEVFLRELASFAQSTEPVTFTFAIGTYGEVIDWYNNRTIDVASLGNAHCVELLQLERAKTSQVYLGDLALM